MKKYFNLLFLLMFAGQLVAQAPQKMSYQAVIRNNTNSVVANQAVGMKISILQGSTNGSAVFEETHKPNTNANGLVSLEIGTGMSNASQFGMIDWSKGPYFIKTETDPSGGANYNIISVTQLLSVPYALHAQQANYAESANYAKRAGRADTAMVVVSTGTNSSSSVEFPTGKNITFTLTSQQWQKVDLSPLIGKRRAFLWLRFTNYSGTFLSGFIRHPGDSFDYKQPYSNNNLSAGAYESCTVSTLTDENGVIECKSYNTTAVTVDVLMVLSQ